MHPDEQASLADGSSPAVTIKTKNLAGDRLAFWDAASTAALVAVVRLDRHPYAKATVSMAAALADALLAERDRRAGDDRP